MLFGGEVQDGTLHLSEFVGTRTNNLKGLAIRRARAWADAS